MQFQPQGDVHQSRAGQAVLALRLDDFAQHAQLFLIELRAIVLHAEVHGVPLRFAPQADQARALGGHAIFIGVFHQILQDEAGHAYLRAVLGQRLHLCLNALAKADGLDIDIQLRVFVFLARGHDFPMGARGIKIELRQLFRHILYALIILQLRHGADIQQAVVQKMRVHLGMQLFEFHLLHQDLLAVVFVDQLADAPQHGGKSIGKQLELAGAHGRNIEREFAIAHLFAALRQLVHRPVDLAVKHPDKAGHQHDGAQANQLEGQPVGVRLRAQRLFRQQHHQLQLSIEQRIAARDVIFPIQCHAPRLPSGIHKAGRRGPSIFVIRKERPSIPRAQI